MPAGVIFDVDGTLVDTNYLHVVAWARAFESQGHRVPMSVIHRLIGQGSERLVDTVLGRVDNAVVEAHADYYASSLHELRPFDGASKLLRRCKDEGLRVVLATSASKRDVRYLTRAIDADDVIDHVATSDDADKSKPAPDIVETAIDGAGLDATDCVFVGDSVWDVEAAKKAGMPCVAVLSGGIDATPLRGAGAVATYDDVADLLAKFPDSLLGSLAAADR